MAIQYKFFMISMKNTTEAEEVFNRFLRGGNIINITKEFVGQGENSFWSIAVEYHTGTGSSAGDKRSRVDYREVLSPEDFAIYAKLREWRRTIAEKEATQLFNVFTNEQMAKIVENKIVTKEGLKKISGVGDARIKKYGDAVIEMVRESIRQAKEQPTPETDKPAPKGEMDCRRMGHRHPGPTHGAAHRLHQGGRCKGVSRKRHSTIWGFVLLERTGCFVAARGTTTRGTAGPPTGTGTRPPTATPTTDSGSSSPQLNGQRRMTAR